MNVEWCDAPPEPARRGGRPRRTAAFVDALRSNPGQWAKYEPHQGHNQGLAGYMRWKYGMEATARMRPDGQHDIYARWNPEAQS